MGLQGMNPYFKFWEKYFSEQEFNDMKKIIIKEEAGPLHFSYDTFIPALVNLVFRLLIMYEAVFFSWRTKSKQEKTKLKKFNFFKLTGSNHFPDDKFEVTLTDREDKNSQLLKAYDEWSKSLALDKDIGGFNLTNLVDFFQDRDMGEIVQTAIKYYNQQHPAKFDPPESGAYDPS